MPKYTKMLAYVGLFALFAVVVHAASLVADPTPVGSSFDVNTIITMLTPIIVPLVIAGMKQILPKIPSVFLPIIAPILGVVIALISAAATAHSSNLYLAAVLGLAGVGVREVKDQLLPATNAGVVGLLALCLIMPLTYGCASGIAPGGPYASKVVYDADVSIETAYKVIDGFLMFETQNHLVLSSAHPEITNIANNIRQGAPKWFASAEALRDTYEANPTTDNLSKLNAGLALLTTAITQAELYYTP